jgi:hypothetical protein
MAPRHTDDKAQPDEIRCYDAEGRLTGVLRKVDPAEEKQIVDDVLGYALRSLSYGAGPGTGMLPGVASVHHGPARDDPRFAFLQDRELARTGADEAIGRLADRMYWKPRPGDEPLTADQRRAMAERAVRAVLAAETEQQARTVRDGQTWIKVAPNGPKALLRPWVDLVVDGYWRWFKAQVIKIARVPVTAPKAIIRKVPTLLDLDVTERTAREVQIPAGFDRPDSLADAEDALLTAEQERAIDAVLSEAIGLLHGREREYAERLAPTMRAVDGCLETARESIARALALSPDNARQLHRRVCAKLRASALAPRVHRLFSR